MKRLLIIFAFALIVSGCEKAEDVKPSVKKCEMYKHMQMRFFDNKGNITEWKDHGTMVYDKTTFHSNDCTDEGLIIRGNTHNQHDGSTYVFRFVVRNRF